MQEDLCKYSSRRNLVWNFTSNDDTLCSHLRENLRVILISSVYPNYLSLYCPSSWFMFSAPVNAFCTWTMNVVCAFFWTLDFLYCQSWYDNEHFCSSKSPVLKLMFSDQFLLLVTSTAFSSSYFYLIVKRFLYQPRRISKQKLHNEARLLWQWL